MLRSRSCSRDCAGLIEYVDDVVGNGVSDAVFEDLRRGEGEVSLMLKTLEFCISGTMDIDEKLSTENGPVANLSCSLVFHSI